MTRVAAVVALLLLAACGSSGPAARAERTSRPSSTAATSSTTRPAPTSTTVNAKVADQFTQLALTAAVNAAHSIYAQSYDYTAVTPETLAPLVPDLHLGPLDQAGVSVIGVLAQDRNDVLIVTKSASGRWYCVTDNATDGISYGSGPTRDSVNSNGACQQPAWPPA